MFVVDTNVLIYAADQDSEFHEPCREQLEKWRRQASPWYLTWSVCYEFLRVSTHPRVFRQPWSKAGVALYRCCVCFAGNKYAGPN